MPVQKKKLKPNDISAGKLATLHKRLFDWGKTHYLDFPWRNTTNRFHAIIAEIMLQRTNAKQVVPVFNSFTETYTRCLDVVNEDPVKLERLLQPLGLSWRTRKIIQLSKVLHEKGEKIPDSKQDLIKLPGIGEYISNAYLSFFRDIRAPIIDRNAVRLWGRICGFEVDRETHRKKWFIELCWKLTPYDNFKEFNYALLDFTRTVCKRKPMCNECPLNSICMSTNRYDVLMGK